MRKTHIEEKNTTYFKHWKVGMKLALASFIHGWFPNLLKDYVSSRVCKKDVIELCDVCGERFPYPSGGEVVAGFGICHQCYINVKKNATKRG